MENQYKTIILASNNQHKIIEIKDIFRDLPYKIISLKEAGIDIDVVEDGNTFADNAYKKAKAIKDICGEAVLADDSGLEVDALNGAPGVYSARFSGEHGNDKANNEKLLKLIEDVPYEDRHARFVSSICLLFSDGEEIKVEGYVEGIIGYAEKGYNGFGYDPLFIIPGLSKTFAELEAHEKNAISHRARALELLKIKLEEMNRIENSQF